MIEPDCMQPIEIDKEIKMFPYVGDTILVSLFVEANNQQMCRLVLFDSCDKAYMSKWQDRMHIPEKDDYLSLQHNPTSYTMRCQYYSIIYGMLSFVETHLCIYPSLCKEHIVDPELLHKLENDFYPSIFTGLK